MNPIDLILSKLPDAKRNGTGWQARCPAHEDGRPNRLLIPRKRATGLLLRPLALQQGGNALFPDPPPSALDPLLG